MKAWLVLLVAIALEVLGTASLKASDGLTRRGWLVVTLVAYSGAFAALALTLKSLPVAYAYAAWSGLGTVGAALIGRFVFREALGSMQLIGVALVLGGIVVMNLSRSGTAP